MRSGANTVYWVREKAGIRGPLDQGLLVAMVRARLLGDEAVVANGPNGPWQPAASILPPSLPGDDGLPEEDLGAKAAKQEGRWLAAGLVVVLIEVGYFITLTASTSSNGRFSVANPRVDKIDYSQPRSIVPRQTDVDPLNPPTDLSPYETTQLLKSYDPLPIQLGLHPNAISAPFHAVEVQTMVIGGTSKPQRIKVNGAYLSTLANLWQAADAERQTYVSLCEETKAKYLELSQSKTFDMLTRSMGFKESQPALSVKKAAEFKATALARIQAYEKLVNAAAAFNSRLLKLDTIPDLEPANKR